MAGLAIEASISLKTEAVQPMIDALKAVCDAARSGANSEQLIELCNAAATLFAESLEVK